MDACDEEQGVGRQGLVSDESTFGDNRPWPGRSMECFEPAGAELRDRQPNESSKGRQHSELHEKRVIA